MIKSNKATLFLVQVPGAIHGSSIIGQNLVEKVSQENDKVIPINLSMSNNDINKLSFNKIILVFHQLYTVLKTRKEINQYVLAYTASGVVFYRDLIITVILRKKRKLLLMNNKGVKKFGRLKRCFAQYFFNKSDVIVNSKYLISDFQLLDTSRINFYEIPNPDFNDKIREQVPRNFKKISALYLSNLHRSKGVFETIEICKIISQLTNIELELNICGLLVDITIEELNQKMNEVKGQFSIKYNGPIYGQEKLRFLESADLFLLPTRYSKECFPVSVIEALSCGCLVITTREGGIQSMIEDGHNGFLIDLDNLRAETERVVSLYSVWQQIAENAYTSYVERYTTETWREKWLELITKDYQ